MSHTPAYYLSVDVDGGSVLSLNCQSDDIDVLAAQYERLVVSLVSAIRRRQRISVHGFPLDTEGKPEPIGQSRQDREEAEKAEWLASHTQP